MFSVPIMCTLTLTPLLGKKDKIRVLGGTLKIIKMNNFSVLPFLHLGWEVRVGDFSEVPQGEKKVATGGLASLDPISVLPPSMRLLSIVAL